MTIDRQTPAANAAAASVWGWAAEFRAQMPQELKELQERITANSHEADHKKAILERLRQIRDLLRFSRYRKNPNGKEKADHGMSNDAGGGGSGGEGGGGGLGGEGAQGRKRPKNAYKKL